MIFTAGYVGSFEQKVRTCSSPGETAYEGADRRRAGAAFNYSENDGFIIAIN